MYIDLGFFKDVVIPPHAMPDPSYWKEDDEARGTARASKELFVGCSCTMQQMGLVVVDRWNITHA